MKNILEINELSKKYKAFELSNVSFNLPEGSIMGLIGKNGAGKTTIINLILDIIKRDSGEIRIFDKEYLSKSDKELIGMVFDDNSLPEHLTTKEVNHIYKNFYSNWDEKKYFEFISRLDVPKNIKIKELSKGNKIKLNLIVALSHNPRLLILDEITGSLDPVMRSEILKLFLEFIQDESRSILFSSHITTDLEKIADYITFINNGHVIFCKEKDELIDNYKIVKCKKTKFEEINKSRFIAYLEENNVVECIIGNQDIQKLRLENILIEEASIEETMLILAKGVAL